MATKDTIIPTQNYVAKTHIVHNGQDYYPGDTLAATDVQAAELLAVNAVDPAPVTTA